ncbi:MAG: hypothetical protein ABIH00_00275, partial [Armatimonadota bacterium]
MINLKQQKIKVKMSKENIEEFQKLISEYYPFVINSVKNSYLNMFSSDKKASSHTLNTHAEGLIAGDICPVNNSVLYYKI